MPRDSQAPLGRDSLSGDLEAGPLEFRCGARGCSICRWRDEHAGKVKSTAAVANVESCMSLETKENS